MKARTSCNYLWKQIHYSKSQAVPAVIFCQLFFSYTIKLPTRSRTSVRLTIEGAELYPFIERSITGYRTMQEKANEIKGLETGIIRVGPMPSVACHWLPQLIKGFQKQYSHVQFLFHQEDYNLIPERIKTGAVDFGFTTPPAAPELNTIPIKEGEMLAVLPKTHPLSSQKKHTDRRTYKRTVYPVGRRTLQRTIERFSRSEFRAGHQVYRS